MSKIEVPSRDVQNIT